MFLNREVVREGGRRVQQSLNHYIAEEKRTNFVFSKG